ncbi:uncharacterized protein E0L32_011518 [Thyridium curvatum]|uniref:CBM20 domain-containing protein n=1 Tax=Thyridium curvatum TaxID=1093900 RepID=A0A507BMP5_9PEZI|nr:uncharacterized protein E0L32_011518 [Thyridium curvatum]TPX18769.1 hypothetical protein E0L32_011518 [Thyridium curvatum]
MIFRSVSSFLLSALSVSALSADEWKKQSVYQVMTDRFARTDGSTTASCDLSTYCGGTWQGLINKLDYIQGMGFTAIWISPVVHQISAPGNVDGDSYHGYWAKDFNSLNSNFGTSEDLLRLSTALHSRGMVWKPVLMFGLFTNHMAYPGCRKCVDYSTLTPFNSASYFHSPCSIDYSNTTSVQQCWQGDDNVSLPDLRTENQNVRDFFDPWIAQLVTTYKIDGLRIDSAKHQETSFWPTFGGNATVYMVGEVYEGNPDEFLPFLDVFPGLLNYPVWYWLQRAFQSTSATMTELNTGLANMRSKTTKTVYLGSFSENHDQPRMPAWSSQSSDTALIKNAIAFVMLMDGIPIIYQGQEQKLSGANVPANREAIWLTGYNTQSELYQWVAQINKLRNAIIGINSAYTSSQAMSWTPDRHTIALQKGPSGYSTQPNNCYISAEKRLTPVKQGTSSGTTTACPIPTSVAVTFTEKVTTSYGQTIKIVGNIDALGNWDINRAVTLSASQYSSSNPIWTITINLLAGDSIQYKFINVASSGTVAWEADPNHSYTVPSSCGTTTAAVSNTWQS